MFFHQQVLRENVHVMQEVIWVGLARGLALVLASLICRNKFPGCFPKLVHSHCIYYGIDYVIEQI